MSFPALATPFPQAPVPPVARPFGAPPDDPQSLVLAVELARLAAQWRERWPGLRLNLPQSGTWPLESWPEALRGALDALLQAALQRRPNAALELTLSSTRGLLRVDLQGHDPQARAWLPDALRPAQRLAVWQGGRLLWRAHGKGWKIRLGLPLSPARR
ncbi:hypothetical protein ACNFBT_03335 [Pseudomonas sp. NY15181]|uniref:hypothetical protein n=1 Tax=Pseudomonas sp. NY15181 TaxID=3400349 RepID=UPI003A89110F